MIIGIPPKADKETTVKVIKIIFGIIAGLFALAHCIYLPTLLLRGAHPSQLLASFGGLLIGAAISITLFKSAFKKKAVDEHGKD